MHYKELLRSELDRRCKVNPRYSLRRFARALGIDPSNLSNILSGKRELSLRTAGLVAQKLNLSPLEHKDLFESVILEKNKGLKQSSFKEPLSLDAELFEIIGDWYHYGILQLCRVKNFKNDLKWIASQLAITETEAMLAIERLLRVGLLKKEGTSLKRVEKELEIKNKAQTTPALRKLQKQILEKAIFSLENDPIEERNTSSMTLAINPKKLDQAKKLISDFSSSLTQFLENGEKHRVYNFHVSLYPVQKKEEPRNV